MLNDDASLKAGNNVLGIVKEKRGRFGDEGYEGDLESAQALLTAQKRRSSEKILKELVAQPRRM